MMILFPPKTMSGLKRIIKMVWDSIPRSICENIIEHMKYRWALCIKYKGRRLDKELLRKIPKIKKDIKWKMKSSEINEINGVRVSYNDKFVMRLKKKDIKERKKQLNDQKKVEKEAKEKLDKLLKMKPKEYKQISMKEKKETKEEYENQRARREVYEEEIEELEKMAPLDYLSILNAETKEKLIGLCLDRKLMESSSDDKETIYSDDENEEEEDMEFDDEMELEEYND